MARYTVRSGTPTQINAASDFVNLGWSFSQGVATHDACNSGSIVANNFTAEAGKQYKVTYTVLNRTTGTVTMTIGGVVAAAHTLDGTYTQTVTAVEDGPIEFYSNGNLSISNVVISDGVVAPVTLAFNQSNLVWSTYYSFAPDLMTKFISGFFSFKDGGLWEHNVSETRNNFYGVQYPSRITFYVNMNPTQVKNYYNMRLVGNKPWSATEILIPPRVGKSQGQKSRLKLNRFNNYQGQWIADFLKDMNDPRFTNELDALFKGADLQGCVMKVTIENNDVTEVRLQSVDVQLNAQQYTY